MTYWITRLSGDAQSDNRVVVSQNIANSARQLGFKEINYNLYDVYRLSSQEYRNSLLDGLISGVKEDDIVFMSYPMWILNWAFQQEFIDRVKLKNAKIVAFILDLPTWLETKAYDIETDGFLEQLRTFDLIISQNERFSQRLR
ncbi:MAG: beta-1,6-galactofuranosyltransferase, partial [Streptococcaceae bacterium]|nr:beta-1,6-galactofuranosyltransferase [Streptococcaceae bacterium]